MPDYTDSEGEAQVRFGHWRADQLIAPLADDDLAAIEARCALAQVGPWRVDVGHEIGSNWLVATGCAYEEEARGSWAVCTDHIPASYTNAADGRDDATFIAHARSDIPRLILEIERLRRLLAAQS